MGSRVPTNEEWIERASTIHSNKYDYSKTKYTGAAYKVTIICPIHGEFNQRASQHLRGEGCPKCGIERRADVQRVDVSQFIAAAKEVHCNEYDYSKVVYVNTHTKVIITCPTHGDFRMTPSAHVNSKQGCPKCAGKNRSLPELIDRFKQVHGDRYDYSLVDTTRVYDVVTIMCPDHGPYTQSIKHHLRGLGCSKCSGVYSPTTMEWIERAREQWGGERYDYSQVEYKDTHTPVNITCKMHNVSFMQSPVQHLRSHGCPQCEGENTRAMWEERCGAYHHKAAHISPESLQLLNDIDWLVRQNDTKTLVEIAADLGVDNTTVQSRFYQHNIQPKCHGVNTSQGERDVREFLHQLCVEVVHNDRTVIRPKELDIYVPSHKIAIEYCGLYWHSDKFRNKNDHLDKLVACEAQGIRLITLFEDEWIHNRRIVEQKLQRVLGIHKTTTVGARRCTVISLTHLQKKDFFNANHIQGAGPGSITYGLQYNGAIVAAMTLIKRADGLFDLNRFATSCNVPGGFSRLLSHFKQHHQWNEIISFADRRWSQGGVYEKNGFSLAHITPPDYNYCFGTKRHHRSNFQRSKLPNVLGDQFDPTLTEFENMDRSKYTRIWNCGLLKYSMKRDS